MSVLFLIHCPEKYLNIRKKQNLSRLEQSKRYAFRKSNTCTVSCVQMPDMYIVHNTYILFGPDRLVYMRIFRFFLGQCILRNNLSRLCWKNMAPGPGNSSNISRKIESQENFGEQDPDEQFSKSFTVCRDWLVRE